MADTWLAKLNEAQKTTATSNRLRKGLERIVPNCLEQIEQQLAPRTAFWGEMRAEIETLRLRIRAEVEAYRSRNPTAGPYPPK
jgi:hypothetical protein